MPAAKACRRAADGSASRPYPIRPKDNDVFLNKGDLVRIDSPLNATGSIGGLVATGAVGMLLTFREVR